MSQGLNKVIVIGFLGRDPEMRFSPSGRPVTSFPLGTTRTWTTLDNEKRTETEWFTIVVWGSLAEVCKSSLKKGNQVYIEGRLQSHQWDDKDGNKKRSIEIIANEVIFLSQQIQEPNFEENINEVSEEI